MAVIDIMLRDIVKKHPLSSHVIPEGNSTATTTIQLTTLPTISSFNATVDNIFTTTSGSDVNGKMMAAAAAVDSAVTLEIVTALSLLVGLIQIAFGIFRIGFVSLVFSDQLVSAFSCGASISVIMSQVPAVFQLDGVGKEGGPLSLVYVSNDC